MKQYNVTYWIKANRTATPHMMTVEAQNGAAACKLVKESVKAETGRNAFRPAATQAIENDPITCKEAHAERQLNDIQKRIDELWALECDGATWAEEHRQLYGDVFRENVEQLRAEGYRVTHNDKFVWKVRKIG